MFKTKLMTAAAVVTLAAAGMTGVAYAQSTSATGASDMVGEGTADSSVPGNSPATDTSVQTPLDGARPGGGVSAGMTAGAQSPTQSYSSTAYTGSAQTNSGYTSSSQAMGSVAVGDSASAGAEVGAMASAEPMQPTRTRAENNRMSRKAENKITADLNRQQLQGLPSTSLASSSDTGLRTTDNSSVAAGSLASPSPSTATGDTVSPADDSTMPQSQTRTPALPNSSSSSMPDSGKPGANTNPTDASDSPVQ